jgi:proline iminopeptidase
MWQEHSLPIPDGRLLWCDSGRGPCVVFLHGGPGDEHRSLRSLAEPFTGHYRCVLYDQRGSGGPAFERLDDIPWIDQPEALQELIENFLQYRWRY